MILLISHESEKGPFRVAADTERFMYSISGLTQTLHDLWDIWGKQAVSLTVHVNVKVRIPTVAFYVQSKSTVVKCCLSHIRCASGTEICPSDSESRNLSLLQRAYDIGHYVGDSCIVLHHVQLHHVQNR
jgi:hypothetical protein